ncbi:hypothetical protein HK096_011259, partial [Nowakowskiella sp. JEL0078]
MSQINSRISEYAKKDEAFQRAVISAVHLGYQVNLQRAWEDEKRRMKVSAIPMDDFFEIGCIYEKQWGYSRDLRNKLSNLNIQIKSTE